MQKLMRMPNQIFRKNNRNSKTVLPKLELRVPISPTDNNMRSLRYLLESIQAFGGPISKAAHCVVSVGAKDSEPEQDLEKKYKWTKDYSLEFRWVERDHFREWDYDATGFDRFWVQSDADVVALIDADLLIAGDFDAIVERSHRTKQMLGFMAHVSPFGFEGRSQTPSTEWWERIFEAAGLAAPDFDWQYSGWGLDWSFYNHAKIMTRDSNHRFGPPYFNYGVVLGPRSYVEKMGETFIEELEAVTQVIKGGYKSQIANCLAFVRHNISCGSIPINCNFPLNLPDDEIRALNPDPEGLNDYEDVKIFHYINGRKHFNSPETIQSLLNQTGLTGAWSEFQKKLRIVNSRIDDT